MQEFFQPPPDPINYNAYYAAIRGQLKYVPEIPHSQRRDWAIRTMMEQAVKSDDETILHMSKALAEREVSLVSLLAVRLERPFALPNTHSHGSNNDTLRLFAYDAYDHLSAHFGDDTWEHWFIAPYFAVGDDLRESFYIGVFVDQDITQTVVE